MKEYKIEFDDKVATELEDIAKNTARVKPEDLIELLVIKAIAPWHRVNNKIMEANND